MEKKSDKIKVIPYGRNIIVKVIDFEDSGLPYNLQRNKPTVGIIVCIGANVIRVGIGFKVLIGKHDGYSVGEDLILINERDLLGALVT